MIELEEIFDNYCNNLKNCVKCPYSNNNKADLVGCALNFGYQKGRTEAESEHKAMCETCVHKVSTEDIEQIRTDAIDECIKTISEMMNIAEANMMWSFVKTCDLLIAQIKKIKEKKNE